MNRGVVLPANSTLPVALANRRRCRCRSVELRRRARCRRATARRQKRTIEAAQARCCTQRAFARRSQLGSACRGHRVQHPRFEGFRCLDWARACNSTLRGILVLGIFLNRTRRSAKVADVHDAGRESAPLAHNARRKLGFGRRQPRRHQTKSARARRGRLDLRIAVMAGKQMVRFQSRGAVQSSLGRHDSR